MICLEVAEDPWQHGQCGRLLCKECLDRLGEDKPCPNCREENPQFFEDNRRGGGSQEKTLLPFIPRPLLHMRIGSGDQVVLNQHVWKTAKPITRSHLHVRRQYISLPIVPSRQKRYP